MKPLLFLLAVVLMTSSAIAAPKFHEENVEYSGGGVTMKGYLVYNESITGKRPGVLVVHEWWGNNDYSRMRAHKFAELGYTALAVDMYGDGKIADNPTDATKLMTSVVSDPTAAVQRFQAALDVLDRNSTVDANKVFAVGYCFGGGMVLRMARAGLPLRAVGSFHGGLATKEPAKPGEVKAAVFVANGAADPTVKPEDIAAFESEMKEAGVKYELINYPGALHAFTNPAATELGKKFSMPVAYNEAADKKSWVDFQAFLKTALK